MTRSILPWLYSPGPNGAAKGDRSAQGRYSNSALHAGGLQLVPDPCILPGMRSSLGVCNASSTTVVPTRLLLCYTPWLACSRGGGQTSLGGGQMGAPLAPRSSTLAPLLCYLPRSPPRRIPAAAGLQPRHGPNALLTAAGTDASPAASGKSRADSVFPGARLPPPHSAWP